MLGHEDAHPSIFDPPKKGRCLGGRWALRWWPRDEDLCVDAEKVTEFDDVLEQNTTLVLVVRAAHAQPFFACQLVVRPLHKELET